jgi:hypothetical protein
MTLRITGLTEFMNSSAKNRRKNVSKAGFVSFFRLREGTIILLDSSQRANLNLWTTNVRITAAT